MKIQGIIKLKTNYFDFYNPYTDANLCNDGAQRMKSDRPEPISKDDTFPVGLKIIRGRRLYIEETAGLIVFNPLFYLRVVVELR